jgi:hypothetical protein
MTACCRLAQPEKSRQKKASAVAADRWRERARGAGPIQGFDVAGRRWAEFPLADCGDPLNIRQSDFGGVFAQDGVRRRFPRRASA